jgi:transposase
MDSNALKVLVNKAKEFLPENEFSVFRNQVNEIYLQDELKSLYAGMNHSKECEPWRTEKIFKINQQLQALG